MQKLLTIEKQRKKKKCGEKGKKEKYGSIPNKGGPPSPHPSFPLPPLVVVVVVVVNDNNTSQSAAHIGSKQKQEKKEKKKIGGHFFGF